MHCCKSKQSYAWWKPLSAAGALVCFRLPTPHVCLRQRSCLPAFIAHFSRESNSCSLHFGISSVCQCAYSWKSVAQVVGVYGSWHLGQLQVGLSKARRLCQCSTARIVTLETLAMQMDGEPWLQPPARLDIELKGQALMLRRLNSEPLARMAHTVAEVLDHCERSGIITGSQRHAITTELAAKLHTDH